MLSAGICCTQCDILIQCMSGCGTVFTVKPLNKGRILYLS